MMDDSMMDDLMMDDLMMDDLMMDDLMMDDSMMNGQMTLKKKEEGPKSDRTRMILAHLTCSCNRIIRDSPVP
jgi:hypothetical protein